MAQQIPLELVTKTSNDQEGYTAEPFYSESSTIPIGHVDKAIKTIEAQCSYSEMWKGLSTAGVVVNILFSALIVSGILPSEGTTYIATASAISAIFALIGFNGMNKNDKEAKMLHPLNGDQNPPQYLRKAK